MTKRYLHFAFGVLDVQRIKQLELVFGRMSDDWLRYTGTCWIAWTSQEPSSWLAEISPHLKPNEYFLILELKMQQGILQGMMTQFAWDWLNKVRY